MPDQRPQRHRQLIDYLRALADRLEAEAQEHADQQAEAEARRVRDWMRTVNRKGKIGAVALAVWALERPWRASALAAAVGGGVALAVVGLPWANGEEGTLPVPPAATDSPSPTADTTPTATLSPAATPEELETPEPAAEPVSETPPASRTARQPPERDRGSPPKPTPEQSPKPSPEPSEPDCVLPLRVDLPSLAEVDVCVLPR